MNSKNGSILKLIGLIISGVVLIGGVIGSSYKIASESKEYTDTNIRYLREEQAQKMDKIVDNLSAVKEDMVVVRTILEEKFGKRHDRSDPR